MKKISVQHHYTISVDELFCFFSDEIKVAQKHNQLGAQKYRLKSASTKGKNFEIDSRREVPVGDEVPTALRKFIKEYNGVRQRESWTINSNDSRNCEFRVDLDGMPVKVQGKMTLAPTPKGCVNKVEVNISGTLPIVGNLATEFVAKSIERQMENEYNYIRKTAAETAIV